MEEFKKEIAKMLVDIMKYVLTVIIIAPFIGKFDDYIYVFMLAFGVILFCIIVSVAIYASIEKSKKNNRRKKL